MPFSHPRVALLWRPLEMMQRYELDVTMGLQRCDIVNKIYKYLIYLSLQVVMDSLQRSFGGAEESEDKLQAVGSGVAHDDCAAKDGDGIFDDWQPKAGATHFAGAPLVDAIESVKEVIEVLRLDTDAIVGK